MPLWLDFLRTPMAAPETVRLRRLRFTWLALCILTALCIDFISLLQRWMGQAAPCLAGALITMTLVQSFIYWSAKQQAETATANPTERAE